MTKTALNIRGLKGARAVDGTARFQFVTDDGLVEINIGFAEYMKLMPVLLGALHDLQQSGRDVLTSIQIQQLDVLVDAQSNEVILSVSLGPTGPKMNFELSPEHVDALFRACESLAKTHRRLIQH